MSDYTWQIFIPLSREYADNRSKVHCFKNDKSLCGRHYQVTTDYDVTKDNETVKDINYSDNTLCKKCVKMYKKIEEVGD